MLTEQHMAQLWARMVRIYLHRWTSGAGDADDGTWLTGLKGLTPERLAHGLRECITRTDPWPPSLPEFRGLCLDLLGADAAVDDALREPTRTEIGEWLQQAVDMWDRRHLSDRDLRRRYHAAYEGVARKYAEALIGAQQPLLGEDGSEIVSLVDGMLDGSLRG